MDHQTKSLKISQNMYDCVRLGRWCVPTNRTDTQHDIIITKISNRIHIKPLVHNNHILAMRWPPHAIIMATDVLARNRHQAISNYLAHLIIVGGTWVILRNIPKLRYNQYKFYSREVESLTIRWFPYISFRFSEQRAITWLNHLSLSKPYDLGYIMSPNRHRELAI